MIKNIFNDKSSDNNSLKDCGILSDQAHAYISYTTRLSKKQKNILINQLEPSLGEKIKKLFFAEQLPCIPHTMEQVRILLSGCIKNEDTIEDILTEYKEDIGYRKKINSQQHYSDKRIINTNQLFSKLSIDTKSHLYSVNKKHSLPMSDLVVMASTAKACKGSCQVFVESYLPMIVDITRKDPLVWNDLVDIVVLSYKYNDIDNNLRLILQGEDVGLILSKLQILKQEFSSQE